MDIAQRIWLAWGSRASFLLYTVVTKLITFLWYRQWIPCDRSRGPDERTTHDQRGERCEGMVHEWQAHATQREAPLPQVRAAEQQDRTTAAIVSRNMSSLFMCCSNYVNDPQFRADASVRVCRARGRWAVKYRAWLAFLRHGFSLLLLPDSRPCDKHELMTSPPALRQHNWCGERWIIRRPPNNNPNAVLGRLLFDTLLLAYFSSI